MPCSKEITNNKKKNTLETDHGHGEQTFGCRVEWEEGVG